MRKETFENRKKHVNTSLQTPIKLKYKWSYNYCDQLVLLTLNEISNVEKRKWKQESQNPASAEYVHFLNLYGHYFCHPNIPSSPHSLCFADMKLSVSLRSELQSVRGSWKQATWTRGKCTTEVHLYPQRLYMVTDQLSSRCDCLYMLLLLLCFRNRFWLISVGQEVLKKPLI